MAIVHFSFGAAATTVLVWLFFADAPSPLAAVSSDDRWERLPTVPYPRTAVLVGGGWATLPDVQRITPVGRSVLFDFHKTHWADVFWLHRTFDVLDSGESELLATATLAAFIGVTILSEWWEVRATGAGESPSRST